MRGDAGSEPQYVECRSIEVAHSLPDVKRSVAVLVNNGAVRARLDQSLDDRGRPVVGRVMERRVAAAIGAVEVSPGLDELNDHVEMAVRCRNQERSRPLLRLRIDSGPELKQQTDSGQLTLRGRLEQGRARAIGVAFDVRAPLDEQPHDLVVTLPRRTGQWREAVATFDVRASLEQQRDDSCVSLTSGVRQRRGVADRSVWINAPIEKFSDSG